MKMKITKVMRRDMRLMRAMMKTKTKTKITMRTMNSME